MINKDNHHTPPAASNRAPECPCSASASHRGRRRCAAGRGSRRRRPQRRTPRRARSCRTPTRRRLAADPRIVGVRASPADPRQEHAGRGCNPWRPSYTPASATTTWTGGPQPRARRPWPSVARGTAAWGPARRQSSRPQRDGARGAGASGAERAERAVDVAVRRPRLLEPRRHSLTRPRERGRGGARNARQGPERERRPPMGERQHPQTGVARSGPSHPGSGESEAGSGEGEPGASPGGQRRTPSSKSRFGGRGRKRGKKKALESGHLHYAASLSRASGRAGAGSPPRAEPGRAAASALLSPSPPRRAAPLPPPPPCREALPRSPERRPAPRPSRRQTRLRRRQERERGGVRVSRAGGGGFASAAQGRM